MMPQPRWRRRAGGLWAGLVVALGAVVAVAYIRLPERMAPIAVAAAVVALVLGIALTLRFRAQDREPMITTRDLRRR